MPTCACSGGGGGGGNGGGGGGGGGGGVTSRRSDGGAVVAAALAVAAVRDGDARHVVRLLRDPNVDPNAGRPIARATHTHNNFLPA